MTDKKPKSGLVQRRIAQEKAERAASARRAKDAAEKRKADHHGRISDLELQVAALTRASKAAVLDDEDRRARQEERIAKLERYVGLLTRSNDKRRDAIASLTEKLNAQQDYLQRLHESRAAVVGKKRRRDDLDAGLERELYKG